MSAPGKKLEQRLADIARHLGISVSEVEEFFGMEAMLLLSSADRSKQTGIDLRAEMEKTQRANLVELRRLGPALATMNAYLETRERSLRIIEAALAPPVDASQLPTPESDEALVAQGGILDSNGRHILPTPQQRATNAAARRAEWKAAKVIRDNAKAAKAKADAAANAAVPQPPDQAQVATTRSTFPRFDFAVAEAAIKAAAGIGDAVSPEVFASLTKGETPVLVRAEKGAPLLLSKGALDYAKGFAKKSKAATSLVQTAQEVHKASKGKSTDTKPPGWNDPGMAELRAKVAAHRKKYPTKPTESQPE